MQVSRGIKYKIAEYENETFNVTVSHEELGLMSPGSVENAYSLYRELSYHSKALLILEEVKVGRIHPKDIAQKLQAYLNPGWMVEMKELK